MAGESQADVYASFGASSAVLTGSNPQEHEANMLALNVDTRDGDDSIEVDLYGSGDKYAAEGDDNGFMQVRIGDGSEVTEGSPETTEGDLFDEDGNPIVETTEEFVPLGDTPQSLSEVTEQISEHETGFQEMVADATARGLTPEALAAIEEQYAGDGLTDESYEALKAVGYSKAFVDSYIRGQEALVSQYVQQAKAYAGGEERFDALHAHLKATNSEAAASLEAAFNNRDLATVKAIVNLAGQSFIKKFGKPAERTVTKRAVPAKPEPKGAVEGFKTRDEMVKAMSDSRYRSDAVYRREVELKTYNAKF